ncbi:actin-domain-containing protein [Meredithblackwellia eburnea MCA 4105]
MQTLVVDNGSHTIKALLFDKNLALVEQPLHFTNSVSTAKVDRKRLFIADQLHNDCSDYGGLVIRSPFEKGQLRDWDAQKLVWDRLFSILNVDPSTTRILLTEQPLTLPNIQENYDQLLFDEYNFHSVARIPVASLLFNNSDSTRPSNSHDAPPPCQLIVDSSHSATHVIPIYKGHILNFATQRLEVGGKLLTNYLKEIISYRQLYMMDQTLVVEKAKQECCYVTTQWEKDSERARPSSATTHTDPVDNIVRTYVLPDFVPTSENKLGYMRDPGWVPPTTSLGDDVGTPGEEPKRQQQQQQQQVPDQLLHLANERFTVPEVIFNPSTIDLSQTGLAPLVAHSISLLPHPLQAMFWNNIVLTGGNTLFPGFTERLQRDLRELCDEDWDITVSRVDDPILSPVLSSLPSLRSPTSLPSQSFLTKSDYQDLQATNARRRAAGGATLARNSGSAGSEIYWSRERLVQDLRDVEGIPVV